MWMVFLSLKSNKVKSESGVQSDHSLSSASDSSSESLYSTAMRRERMVATSHPCSSLLFCCSCCSWTFFSWIPVEDKPSLCSQFKQQKSEEKKKRIAKISPPMRMADNRSLLGSLADFASALLPLCPAT